MMYTVYIIAVIMIITMSVDIFIRSIRNIITISSNKIDSTYALCDAFMIKLNRSARMMLIVQILLFIIINILTIVIN